MSDEMTNEEIEEELMLFRMALTKQRERLPKERRRELYMAVMSMYKDENGDWLSEALRLQFVNMQRSALANMAEEALNRLSAQQTLEYLKEHPEEVIG